MPSKTCDLLVLGGGPAGVATALEAAERGMQVVLLERESTTGGMAGSFECDGVRVDFGSHRLHPVTPPEVMQRLTQLLGDDLQMRTRHGRLRLVDRWVHFPLQVRDLATAMPPGWLVRMAGDVILSPITRLRRRRGASSSYARSLRTSLGPTVYDTLYEPYARKLWGLRGDEIDAEQARVRVSADTVPKVALRVLRGSLRQVGHRSAAASGSGSGAASGSTSQAPRGKTFNYPRRGFGQIVEALDAAAGAAGARIETGVTVTSIKPGPVVRVETEDGRSWRAPQVFSTLPIPLLARLSTVPPPPEVVEAARGLRFRAMVLVYLTHRPSAATGHPADETAVDAPVRWSAYDAHYLPGDGTPITRISEPANYRDSSQDPSDRSVVCAEIPCAVGDEIWTADTEALSDVVHRAVANFELPTLHGVAAEVRRLPAVYPIYEHGFAERLARLEQWADGIPGVTTLGRSGLFAHDNTHHALIMARAAVAAIRTDGSFDEQQWARSRELFREHVVED
ncbi:MAG: FAD-dependent oxidoreductase [Ornithinimicrobium sp.]